MMLPLGTNRRGASYREWCGQLNSGGIVGQGRDLGGDSDKEVVGKFGAEGGGRF